MESVLRRAPDLPPAALGPMLRHMVQDHLTPDQVGRLAAAAHVGRLVLTHLAPGNDDERDTRGLRRRNSRALPRPGGRRQRPRSLLMSRYVFVETLISMVINAAISAGFAFLVFGRRTEIDLWGLGGLAWIRAADFHDRDDERSRAQRSHPPADRRGHAPARSGPPSRLPRNLFARALLVAPVATIVLGGAAIALLAAASNGPLAFSDMLPLKILYGAFVAAIVTPLALRAALADRPVGEFR